MMTDNDLDNLYKANIGVSHEAALRAIWDDGYNYALSLTPTSQGVDPSEAASATVAAADEPTASNDPPLNQP